MRSNDLGSALGKALACMLLAGIAAPAAAQTTLRDYCPDRPGYSTAACTIDPGKVSIELSAIDWTQDRTADSVDDTILVGDFGARVGFAEHAELRLFWTPWGQNRSRDRATGQVSRDSGIGDISIGIKRNLIDPTGSGLSVAVLPSVSLPVGSDALGAGDWGASLLVPVNVPLGGPVAFIATPEIDAEPDADGSGRHVAFGTSFGLAIAATDTVALAFEGTIFRDDDPAGSTTQRLAVASVGWMIDDDTQLDIATEIGIGGGAPDTRVYAGIARRF